MQTSGEMRRENAKLCQRHCDPLARKEVTTFRIGHPAGCWLRDSPLHFAAQQSFGKASF
jgi:hypothetical protein